MAVTTTLKLPDDLNERIAPLAAAQGMSPHAWMVEALQAQVALRHPREAGFGLRGNATLPGAGVGSATPPQASRGAGSNTAWNAPAAATASRINCAMMSAAGLIASAKPAAGPSDTMPSSTLPPS